MTITPSTIYWIGICDSIGIGFTIIGVICLIFALISVFAFLDVEWSKGVYIITPIFLLFGLLSFAVAIFVPSSKTAAAMYVVPAIVNNEKIQAVGNGIYDLAVEWMKELKPKYKAETNKEETKNKSATQR